MNAPSFCTEHQQCAKHGEALCLQCSCHHNSSQCFSVCIPEVRENHALDLGRPERRSYRLPNNHEKDRNHDLHSTQKVHNRIDNIGTTTSPDTLLSNLRQHLSYTHFYKEHPELLKDLRSHFQISYETKWKQVYVSLTNISSQAMRREIISHTLKILQQQYGWKPENTLIQSMNQHRRATSVTTTTADQVIQAITTYQRELTDNGLQTPQEVYSHLTQILTHTAEQATQEAPVPQRPIQQKQTTKFFRKNRLRNLYITYSLTIEDLEQAEQQFSIHSSSITTTDQTDQTDQANHQPSSHSTMTTTTTLSTESHTNKIPQGTEQGSPINWELTIKEWSRFIALHKKLTISNTSWNISCAKIYENSAHLVISPEKP